MRQVFVSYTSELDEHPQSGSFVEAARRAIHDQGLQPIDMTNFVASDRVPADAVRESIEECDAVVFVVGFRYGDVPAGHDGSSFVELEYEIAASLRKPRLVFLLDPDTATLPARAVVDREFGQLQDAFRRRLATSQNTVLKTVGDVAQLRIETSRALAALTSIGADVIATQDGQVLEQLRTAILRSDRYVKVPTGQDFVEVDLESVHIEPEIVSADEQRIVGSEARSHTLDELCQDHRRFAVIAAPGGGKTTFTRRLVTSIASGEGVDPVSKSSRSSIPLLVVLRQVENLICDDGEPMVEVLRAVLRRRYQVTVDTSFVERCLVERTAVVIFDGLDEIVDSSRRRMAARSIEVFASRYEAAQVVVTSRPIGYHEAKLDQSLFTHFEIRPFSQSRIKAYVDRWFERSTISSGHSDRAESFLRESEQVSELRSNPLLLALMCSLYRRQGYIPRNRPSIYEKCALLVFEGWDAERGVKSEADGMGGFDDHLGNLLAELAYWIYAEIEDHRVTLIQLQSRAASFFASTFELDEIGSLSMAQQFVGQARRRSWIFQKVDGGDTSDDDLYEFVHRTFLEYYVALHLTRIRTTSATLAKTLVPRIATRSWDVVAELAVQIHAQGVRDGDVAVVRRVLRAAESRRRPTALLGFAVGSLSYIDNRPQLTSEIVDLVLTRQVEEASKIARPNFDWGRIQFDTNLGESYSQVVQPVSLTDESNNDAARGAAMAVFERYMAGRSIIKRQLTAQLFWMFRSLPTEDRDRERIWRELVDGLYQRFADRVDPSPRSTPSAFVLAVARRQLSPDGLVQRWGGECLWKSAPFVVAESYWVPLVDWPFPHYLGLYSSEMMDKEPAWETLRDDIVESVANWLREDGRSSRDIPGPTGRPFFMMGRFRGDFDPPKPNDLEATALCFLARLDSMRNEEWFDEAVREMVAGGLGSLSVLEPYICARFSIESPEHIVNESSSLDSLLIRWSEGEDAIAAFG